MAKVAVPGALVQWAAPSSKPGLLSNSRAWPGAGVDSPKRETRSTSTVSRKKGNLRFMGGFLGPRDGSGKR